MTYVLDPDYECTCVHRDTGLKIRIFEHREYSTIDIARKNLVRRWLETEAGQSVIPNIEGNSWTTCKVLGLRGEIELVRERT